MGVENTISIKINFKTDKVLTEEDKTVIKEDLFELANFGVPDALQEISKKKNFALLNDPFIEVVM